MIRFLFTRHSNRVDGVALVTGGILVAQSHWITAVVVILALSAVSVLGESVLQNGEAG